MEKETKEKFKCDCGKYAGAQNNGAVYGLGLIGALIFYIQQATTIVDGLVGILKALVWPAILVYETLKVLIISV